MIHLETLPDMPRRALALSMQGAAPFAGLIAAQAFMANRMLAAPMLGTLRLVGSAPGAVATSATPAAAPTASPKAKAPAAPKPTVNAKAAAPKSASPATAPKPTPKAKAPAEVKTPAKPSAKPKAAAAKTAAPATPKPSQEAKAPSQEAKAPAPAKAPAKPATKAKAAAPKKAEPEKATAAKTPTPKAAGAEGQTGRRRRAKGARACSQGGPETGGSPRRIGQACGGSTPRYHGLPVEILQWPGEQRDAGGHAEGRWHQGHGLEGVALGRTGQGPDRPRRAAHRAGDDRLGASVGLCAADRRWSGAGAALCDPSDALRAGGLHLVSGCHIQTLAKDAQNVRAAPARRHDERNTHVAGQGSYLHQYLRDA